MNWFVAVALAVAVYTPTAALVTGCAWVRAHPQAPEAIAQQVAQSVTREVLLAHPEHRAKFIDAEVRLTALEANPLVSATDVIAVINLLPSHLLATSTARISVDGLTLTVMLTGNPALPTETSDQLKAIVRGLRAGIAAGRAQVP